VLGQNNSEGGHGDDPRLDVSGSAGRCWWFLLNIPEAPVYPNLDSEPGASRGSTGSDWIIGKIGSDVTAVSPSGGHSDDSGHNVSGAPGN
jgi:hypothetical protein